MAQHGLDRRSFIRNAGLTAFAGAVASKTSLAALEVPEAGAAAPNGKYDFDTVYSRIGSNCVKWDRPLVQYGKDSIDVGMGIADMDFRVAPAITKGLAERMKHENWGYLDSMQPFIDSVVAWNKHRYGLEIDPKTVVMATGVHPGLIAALKTFSPPGSKVLLLSPTYNGFYSDLTFTGTIPSDSPMKVVNGRYQIDFDDFDRRISQDTHTFILCNPQNPTGNCWSKDDLMTLGEICLKRRVVVLSDEIHCDFVSKGQKYTPFASLPNRDIVNNSLTFKAASKSFGLAAWKCGWFFSTNADYLARVKANHRADLTTMGLVASQSAYAEGEDWLNQVVEYIDGTLDFVESYVRTNLPMVKYAKPQGTYLAWLDFTDLANRIGTKAMAVEENKRNPNVPPVTPETMLERWLVKHARVQLNAGHTYGTGGANHMRMNIGTSRKLVELALKNIGEACRNT